MAKSTKTQKEAKAKKAAKATKPKETAVKWSEMFDSIWCISFTGYTERKKAVESELDRLGILDSGIFNWRFTFPTIFDNLLYDVTKKRLKRNNCQNVPSMSCTLGHYGCIKTSYERGDDFILVMEDDIRFLKDAGRIRDIIKKIPPCADVVNFDALPSGTQWDAAKYSKFVSDNSYNDEFYSYSGMMGAACYALSRKAMKAICIRCEQMLMPFDLYTSGNVYLGSDVSRYAAKEALCCQLTYGKSVNVASFGDDSLHKPYSVKGLDYSKYNIFDMDGYTYGSSI